MAERCFPLNDTDYLAEDMRMFHAGRSVGVINVTGNDFLTRPGTGMQVIVAKGVAYLKTDVDGLGGIVYANQSDLTLNLDPADAILQRYDAIVIRYEKETNTCAMKIVKGELSSSPTKYIPERTAVAYELVIKYIHVRQGIGAVTSDLIEDAILNEDVCGIAVDTLASVPTGQYDQQFNTWLTQEQSDFSDWRNQQQQDFNTWKDNSEDSFEEWFAEIKNQLDSDVAGALQKQIVQNSPIGEIKMYAGQTEPEGWLFCKGQALSRSEYSNLFEVIGTAFGTGDGSTTFNLPNLQKRFPVGVGNGYGLGKTGGEETHTLTTEEMPEHTHNQKAHGHTGSGSASEAGNHTHTASSASAGAHTHALTINAGGSHTHSASTGSGGSHAHDIIIYGYGRSASLDSGSDDSYRVQYDSSNANYSNGRFYTQTGGAHTHSVSVTSAGSHNHSGTANSAGGHTHTITVASAGAHTHTISVTISETTAENENTGGGLAHNNMPPYIALNYIIKY